MELVKCQVENKYIQMAIKNSKSKQKSKILDTNLELKFDINQQYKLCEVHKDFVTNSFKQNTKIVMIDGPAGSSKTYLSAYVALSLLKQKHVKEIVYIRSVVESASKKLGFLPGDEHSKFQPWSLPMIEKCDELIGMVETNNLLSAELIKCTPVNFLRGTTFKDVAVIVDEAQNLELNELITILTRFGNNSKLFLIGDSMQSDINGKSGFRKIYEAFNNKDSEQNGILNFKFTNNEITRSELLKYIISVVEHIKK